ncbi:MAG: phage ORF5 protein [Anaerovoracaceae bacterium]|nr:MAG TPA: DNA binding protein [Microviridae sp.]
MKNSLFSIKDKLVGYGPVFMEQNEDVAIRAFQNSVKIANDTDEYNSVCDLELHCVGSFDTETGCVESCEPVWLCSGLDVIRLHKHAPDSFDEDVKKN